MGAKMGRNELTMSRFYTESSDYTNGGNSQKIFCMAYGTSAAICASFHKNWHWHLWWSAVTAKNTASPEQGVGVKGREGRREEKKREEKNWCSCWIDSWSATQILISADSIFRFQTWRASFPGHEIRFLLQLFLKTWRVAQPGWACVCVSAALIIKAIPHTDRRAPTLWPAFVLLTFPAGPSVSLLPEHPGTFSTGDYFGWGFGR